MLFSQIGFNSLKSLVPAREFPAQASLGTARRSARPPIRELGKAKPIYQRQQPQKQQSQIPQLDLKNVSGDLINKVQGVINKYGKGKSPIKAEQLLATAQKSGVPVDFLLVSGIQESSLGTAGRAVSTKNIYNVGNTDGGDGKKAAKNKFNEFHNDWQSGIDRFTSLITKQYFPGKSASLDAFIANDFRRPDGARYMTNPKAKEAYISLAKSVRNMLK